jgi:hypothetical protein
MIFAIITAWLAYKRANLNGRNGILWGAIGAGVFIGIQLIVSLGAGVALGLGQAVYGWNDSVYESVSAPLTAASIISSFLGSWVLLRYLDRPVADKSHSDGPPPPPHFGGTT